MTERDSRNEPATAGGGAPARVEAAGTGASGSPPEAPTDDEIIDAVLGGDQERFAELVIRYQQAAWRIAYGFVGHMEDARELSQNGFVKAYRHLRQFRRRAKFSTWLYRIIANECKDFFKRKRRQPTLLPLVMDDGSGEETFFEVADPSATPGDALANRELARALGRAIGALSHQQRQAFVLHHLNGLSLEETSRVMGCRVGTVKAHVFRACEQLRGRLAPSLGMEVAR